MGAKVQVINDIMSSLKDLDQKTLDRIENILYVNFKKYDIKETCTEIVIHDDSNLGLIKKSLQLKSWKESLFEH